MDVDYSCRGHEFKIYANQIILDKIYNLYDKFVFYNRDSMIFKVKIVVPEPFYLLLSNKLRSAGKFTVDAKRSIEVSNYIIKIVL